MDVSESDPDILALTKQLGLRGLTYRTFSRPPIVSRPARPEPPADPAPVESVAVATAFEPPAPAAIVAVTSAPAFPAPLVAVASIPRAPQPPMHFPLLSQALAPREAQPVPAASAGAAQTFLNLRRAVTGAGDDTGH